METDETWDEGHMWNGNANIRGDTDCDEEVCRTDILHGEIIRWFLTYISRVINMYIFSH